VRFKEDPLVQLGTNNKEFVETLIQRRTIGKYYETQISQGLYSGLVDQGRTKIYQRRF
jgi:hypothetical protein